MTEAEKAAAAKAEAEKKAAAEKAAAEKKAKEAEAATAEADGEDGDDVAADETISAKDFAAYKKKMNKEAEKNRLENKALAEQLSGMKTGIAKALGLGNDQAAADQVANGAKTAADRQKNLLLRAAFAEVAGPAGALNVSDAFALAKPYLRDVKVDVDEENVDPDGLAEAVAELKKSKPYLFRGESGGAEGGGDEGQGGSEKPPKKKMPDGGGKPKAGGSAYDEWNTLVKSGNKDRANEYYAKNVKDIRASWPK